VAVLQETIDRFSLRFQAKPTLSLSRGGHSEVADESLCRHGKYSYGKSVKPTFTVFIIAPYFSQGGPPPPERYRKKFDRPPYGRL
jgi:hypothetical protein